MAVESLSSRYLVVIVVDMDGGCLCFVRVHVLNATSMSQMGCPSASFVVPESGKFAYIFTAPQLPCCHERGV